jgi:hypothetical protein
MTTKTSTTPAPLMVALTTIVLQDTVIHRGDRLPADHPHIAPRVNLFASADLPTEELRALEAELITDSNSATYQHPPAPPPIKMRARRAFEVEVLTSSMRRIEKGEVHFSDSDVFLDSPAEFEPVRGGK